MSTSTDRLSLPLLAAAQAQKEMTHNEALTLIDAAVQAVVVAVGPGAVPTSPAAGQCWVVGAGAADAWTGHDAALAIWTAGGWRFVAPFEGTRVWSVADGCEARYASGDWVIGSVAAAQIVIGGDRVVGARQPAIALPAGGSINDSQARDAIGAIIAALSAHGLIAT